MNTFLHPLEVVTTVVLVVFIPIGVFSTTTFSFILVLVNSNTFFGARSSGLRSIFAPVSGHSSVNSDAVSSFSPLASELLLEDVKLDTEDS